MLVPDSVLRWLNSREGTDWIGAMEQVQTREEGKDTMMERKGFEDMLSFTDRWEIHISGATRCVSLCVCVSVPHVREIQDVQV